jgi:plastocyanin
VSRHSRKLALGATCALAALIPVGSAQALTKTVIVGTPASAQKTIGNTYNGDVDAFFPTSITIDAGDKVRFVPSGFHTVEIPPKGSSDSALVQPFTGKVAGANDAAGTPFWFNGQDNLYFALPLVQKQNFGKSLKYTGKNRVQSGLPLANKPKPMVVTFTKKGKYTYFCNLHPGMKATVTVQKKGATRPPAAFDKRVVKQQVNSATKVATDLQAARPEDGTIQLGASGKGGVEIFAFFPAQTTVPVGTTIKFAMPKGSREDHTATAGPGNPETEPSSYLGTLAGSLQGPPPFNPAAVYPSDAPGGAATSLTSATHGNGFWNSGFLDQSTATPISDSSSVKFDQAGTYTFYCLVHPFMKGTVVVQ